MKELPFKKIITFLLENVRDKNHIIFKSSLFTSYLQTFTSYLQEKITFKTYFEKRLLLLDNHKQRYDNNEVMEFLNSMYVLPHQNQSVEATFKSGKRASKAKGANTSENTMNDVFITTSDGIAMISKVQKINRAKNLRVKI